MARPGLRNHPKFRRLRAAIGLPAVYVEAHLEAMWKSGYETGNPYLGDKADVELAAEWEDSGKPTGAWFKAALACGWIDSVGGGKYQIHDLIENAPDYVKRRALRERERKDKGLHQNMSVNGRQPSVTDRQTPTSQDSQNGFGATPAPAPAPVNTNPSYEGLSASADATEPEATPSEPPGKQKPTAEPKSGNSRTAARRPKGGPGRTGATALPEPSHSDTAELDGSEPSPEPPPVAEQATPAEPEPGQPDTGTAPSTETPEAKPKARRKNPDADPNHRPAVLAFCEQWRGKYGVKYPFAGGKDGEAVAWMLRQVEGDLSRLTKIFGAYFADPDPFFAKDRNSVAVLKSQWRKFITGPPKAEDDPYGILGPRVVPPDDWFTDRGWSDVDATKPEAKP